MYKGVDLYHLYIILATVTAVAISAFIIWRSTILYNLACQIANDTLKKEKDDGSLRYAGDKLTMFSAWIVVLGSYIVYQIRVGFDFNAWLILVGVAIGIKSSDAAAKRILNGRKAKDVIKDKEA
jgi:hypothetical protein